MQSLLAPSSRCTIDAHHHLWRYDRSDHRWIDPSGPLARDHELDELMQVADAVGVTGFIAVQARQCEAETDWLLDQSRRNHRILGVVGWVDLRSDKIDDRLERWTGSPALVGMRHVVQDEREDDFLLGDAFVRGVRAAIARDLAYDILITPRQLRHVPAFAAAVGGGRLIIDHGAKPDIAGGGWQPWARDVATAASIPGVYCKLSGLVTEAGPGWRADQIARYLDHLLACFGPDRLIFGSDWPVCRLTASYAGVHGMIDEFVRRECPEHRRAVFFDNAVRAYRLDVGSLRVERRESEERDPR